MAKVIAVGVVSHGVEGPHARRPFAPDGVHAEQTLGGLKALPLVGLGAFDLKEGLITVGVNDAQVGDLSHFSARSAIGGKDTLHKLGEPTVEVSRLGTLHQVLGLSSSALGDSAGDPVCTSSTSEAPTRHHAGEFVETAIKHGVCPADERRQRAPKRGEHGRVERPPGVRQEGWAQGPVGRGRDRGEEGWLKDTLRVSAKPVRHLAKRVGTGHSESPWPFYTCLYVRSTNASCILCVYSFCNRTLRGAATPRCHAARGPRRSGVFLESVRPPQPVEGPSSTPL